MAYATGIRQSDLVVLEYAANPCEVRLTGKVPTDIQIDLEAGTWSYKDKTLNGSGLQGFEIGAQYRYCTSGCRGGVIGVYDRTIISQLQEMLYAAKKATLGQGSLLED